MLCPVDQTELVMTERQGVEIDYCPTCRGVWLDRGELDKIIERANATAASDAATNEAGSAGASAGSAAKGAFTTPRVGDMQGRVVPLESERREDEPDSDWEQRKHRKTKRRSFFEELFDFE